MDEQQYIFGANIIENLTTGMYQDSKVIYREYIQNACDQIDKAEKLGILDENEAVIEIWIDENERSISIEDNATGISAEEFKDTLGNIANSSKKIGEDKGFRGIGRLAGLAYCKKLIFTASAKGEGIISKMECDALLMRQLLNEHIQGKKHTAEEVLNEIFSFSTESTTDYDNHFFKVELLGVNKENKDLLDKTIIQEYLSFVAPVPYANKFYIRSKIKKYAEENNHCIDEYNIKINGEQLFKQYMMNYIVRQGKDTIRDIAFHEFRDDNNELLAWMWLAVSGFKGSIPASCKMRCLRIRKENIQIGDEDALQRFFTEDRGVRYFIGELFVTSSELIPNSQRDYFNENQTRVVFEQIFRKYVNDGLNKIYRAGSDMNASLKAVKKYDTVAAEHEEKVAYNEYANEKQALKKEEELNELKKKAEKAKKTIKNLISKDTENDANDIIVNFVSKRVEEYREAKKEKHEDAKVETLKFNDSKGKATADTNKKENESVKSLGHSKDVKTIKGMGTRRTDKLSSLSKKDRMLVGKIYDVILKQVDEDIADKIFKAIEDKLR